MEFLSSLGGWAWVIGGLLLMILEAVVPGVFLVWFGTAAIITGIVIVLFGFSLSSQFLVFAVFATASVLFGWKYGRYAQGESDRPLLNIRGKQYVGQTFHLEEAIVNGRGRIRVGDSTWRVEGPPAEAGAPVRVVGVSGATLKVEVSDDTVDA